jgi:uncharacterized protein
LLRIVAVEHSADQVSVVPDPTRSRPGRGAHLHRDPGCLALAQRRRAFARALRVTGVVDIGELVSAIVAGTGTMVGGGTSPTPLATPAEPANLTTTGKVGRPT